MKYISLLRGINVSGQKKVVMSDLKTLYEALGFQNVVTYIQSGNVIFEATSKSKTNVKDHIEQAIKKNYSFHVPVEIRTKSELEAITENIPFRSINVSEDGTKVLVTFLSRRPTAVKVGELQQYVVAPEKLVVKGTEVYLYCPNGYGTSKLSNNFLEQKLGVEATTRNWKSVLKLYDLSV